MVQPIVLLEKVGYNIVVVHRFSTSMKGVTPLRAQSTKASRRARRRSIAVALQLIICFPLGLYVMWTRTRWPRIVKSSVSAAAALLLAAILVPLTDPPEREVGFVHLVDEKPQVDIHGPEAPADREVIEIYAPRRTAILLEPTATPVPVVVYCNNGGKYYHSEECIYVKEDTPDVSLTRAIEAGYSKCPDCHAPEPY